MKRTKERTELEQENEERQAMFASSISDAMRHQGSKFVIEPSYVNIENLSFGRMAFGGMNPEIEKMAQDQQAILEEAEAERKEKDVQDEDMVEFYSSMSNTIGKKFATKRNYAGQQKSEDLPSASGQDLMSKGHKFVQGMRQQNHTWKKDQQDFKRRKMLKPNMD